MPQTTFLDDPAHPGQCKNCGKPKDVWHGGDRFASKGEVCDRSRAYVWRTLRAEDVPVMLAALEHLKTYTLGKDAHLRVVPRGSTGDDSWAHSYGYDELHRQNETHAAIMDGWAGEYHGTLEKMSDAWESFEKGWRAHAAVPVRIDLRRESEWVLRVGTRTIYVWGKGDVPVPHYASGLDGFNLTPDLDKAHGFRSRREATDSLNQVHSVHSRRVVDAWDPSIAQRANMR